MKLAEILLHRTELNEKLKSIGSRLYFNLKIQEGDKATEDPNALINELFAVGNQLTVIQNKIDIANSINLTSKNRSILEALSEREILKKVYSKLHSGTSLVTETEARYSRRDIRNIKTIEVKAYRDYLEHTLSKLRAVETEILAANWQIDIE